jgi:hypothetical protein
MVEFGNIKGEAFVDGKRMADAQWSATIVDKNN